MVSTLPLTQYTFSAWGKVQNISGNTQPFISIGEYDVDKTFLHSTRLHYGYGSSDWTTKTETFTTGSDTVFLRVAITNGLTNGTFYVDDIELFKTGTGENLIVNHDFESVYNFDDYPCDGLRIDSVTMDYSWSEFENYRRSHWTYIDHPLVFSYDTKEPVLLGGMSQYEFLENMHVKMVDGENILIGNMFDKANPFYSHLFDVLGSERWELNYWDSFDCQYRTMGYKKPITNMLVWNRHGSDEVTHSEVETYINKQMFYGMFPTVSIYNDEWDNFWGSPLIQDRDRELFKNYIPIIQEISSAGWEPIPYATCDNPEIMFERYGDSEESLYYTVTSCNSTTENGVLLVDLSKLGFDGTHVEVRELVTDTSHTQDVQEGKICIAIASLTPNETRVYRINL
jgi:hypothetical protein